jgi:uncharacterized membrane protein
MSNLLNPSEEQLNKGRKVLYFIGSLLTGVLSMFAGAMVFVGGLMFLQPVLNAAKNYIPMVTFSFGVDLVEVFPLCYWVGFTVLAAFLFCIGGSRVIDTVDTQGLVSSFFDTSKKKEVANHEITQ